MERQNTKPVGQSNGCKNQFGNALSLTGGAVISFDDNNIDNWHMAHNILERYYWKATFFVSRFHTLDSGKMEKLNELKKYGHEIAGHGLNHLNAAEYVTNHGIDAYMEDEIYAMKKIMGEKGFDVTSFAYPYGGRNTAIDSTLLNEFKIVRATTYGSLAPCLHKCFYNNNNLVYGLGIDNSYGLETSYIKSLIDHAKSEGKAVIFYAHTPVKIIDGNYQIKVSRLAEICEYIGDLGMKYTTISDLYQNFPLLEIPKNLEISP